MEFVFDFDGTICDSFSKAVEIANAYLARSGRLPITETELRNKGIKKIIEERKLSLWQKLMLVRTARRESAKYINEFKAYKGIPEILARLHARNRIGILTSNSEKNVRKFLKNNDMNGYIDFILSNSNLFGKDKVLRKVKPDFYIGDETRDVEAANKSGVKSVAVTWGYESKELLGRAYPKFIVNSPKKIISLLLPLEKK